MIAGKRTNHSAEYFGEMQPLREVQDIVEAIKTVFAMLKDEKETYLGVINKKKQHEREFLLEQRVTNKDMQPFLCILKQWNSYTPILPSDQPHMARKGGGYYLYCDNYGLVIDPGFNFVQNFLTQGFKLADIDGILISHAHNDHTIELEQICGLLARKHSNGESLQQVDIFFNLGSFKKYASLFDLGRQEPDYIRKIVLLNPHQCYQLTSDFSFFTTSAMHPELITQNYSLGFIFQCYDRLIRYTGDTRWNSDKEWENLRCAYERANFDIDSGVDILLSNIGTIDEKEFQYDDARSLQENERLVFYDKHLGLLGTIAMIKMWRPKLVIVSEFGEELDMLREPLAKNLEQGTGVKVVPSDIGLVIRLEEQELSFWCQYCGKWEDIGEIDYGRGYLQNIVYMGAKCVSNVERKATIDDLSTNTKRLDKFVQYLQGHSE